MSQFGTIASIPELGSKLNYSERIIGSFSSNHEVFDALEFLEYEELAEIERELGLVAVRKLVEVE